MKKLLLLLMMLPMIAHSQVRIGFTTAEVREEFPDVKDNWENGHTLRRVTNTTMTVYFANDSEIIEKCAVVVPSGAAMNGYVEYLNNNCTIISKREWNQYTSDGILRCVLGVTDDKTVYFLWTAL